MLLCHKTDFDNTVYGYSAVDNHDKFNLVKKTNNKYLFLISDTNKI